MSNVTWMLKIYLQKYFDLDSLIYEMKTTVMRSFFIQ
jgi:hypothetical protein